MSLSPSDTITKIFSIRNASGTPIAADEMPTADIEISGVPSDVIPSVTLRADGKYQVSAAVPADAAEGASVEIVFNAIVSTQQYCDEYFAGLVKSTDNTVSELLSYAKNRLRFNTDTQEMELYADDNVTLLQRWPALTSGGEPVQAQFGVMSERQGPLL